MKLPGAAELDGSWEVAGGQAGVQAGLWLGSGWDSARKGQNLGRDRSWGGCGPSLWQQPGGH